MARRPSARRRAWTRLYRFLRSRGIDRRPERVQQAARWNPARYPEVKYFNRGNGRYFVVEIHDRTPAVVGSTNEAAREVISQHADWPWVVQHAMDRWIGWAVPIEELGGA